MYDRLLSLLTMSDDDSSSQSNSDGKPRANGKEALGERIEKGYTGDGDGDGDLGSEGGYGVIRPSAEDTTSGDSSTSDSESE